MSRLMSSVACPVAEEASAQYCFEHGNSMRVVDLDR